MEIWLNTFVSVAIISLISLVGIFFMSLHEKKLQNIQLILVAFSAGGLLGGAFFHLLPEAFESIEDATVASSLLMAGFISLFILEKYLHWHHKHSTKHILLKNDVKPLGPLNLFADVFHNLLDGVLIGAAYLYNFELGVTTTIIVLMHELPQEIGDFGVLVHAGYKPRKALFFNFLSACTSFLGAFLALWLGSTSDRLEAYILPLAAGSFLYLASADLIPELQSEYQVKKSIVQLLSLFVGMGLLFILLFLEF